MLVVTATIDGATQVVGDFDHLADEAQPAVMRGLTRAGRGIYDIALTLLSGPGRTPVRTQGKREWTATGYRNVNPTRARGQHSFLGARPGSYPVPGLTGHLRRELSILEPGESKKADAGTVRAAKDEVIVYNGAAYGRAIHEGEGTSKKHGRRPYMDDAVRIYDLGGGIAADVDDELAKELDKA